MTEQRRRSGISSLTIEGGTLFVLIRLAIPRIARILKIFEPTILPIAKSGASLNAARRLVTISGAEVPAAMMVRPIMAGLILKREAILIEDLTNASPPRINIIKPRTIEPIISKSSNEYPCDCRIQGAS